MQVDLLDERAILFLWNCEIGRNLGNTQSSSSSSESWVYRNLVHSCTDSIFCSKNAKKLHNFARRTVIWARTISKAHTHTEYCCMEKNIDVWCEILQTKRKFLSCLFPLFLRKCNFTQLPLWRDRNVPEMCEELDSVREAAKSRYPDCPQTPTPLTLCCVCALNSTAPPPIWGRTYNNFHLHCKSVPHPPKKENTKFSLV